MPIKPSPGSGKLKLAPRRRGVTLLEMLVVMVIIGAMAAISLPAFSAGIDSVRMSSATQSVATFLNAAVTRAERRQQPVELVISPRENRMAIHSNEPNSARELALPDGVAINAVLPEEETEDGARRFVLLPGGTAPGIGIELGNRRGVRRIVRLDPATGFPRVENVSSR